MEDLIIRITDKLFPDDDCKSMKLETMNNIFSSINRINTLTIIGGEIMLAYDELELLINSIIMNDVHINHIKLLTTGTIYDERIYQILYNNFEEDFSVGIINSPNLDELLDIMYPFTEECSDDPLMHPINSKEAVYNIKRHYFNKCSIGWVNESEYYYVTYIDIDGNINIRGNNIVAEKRQAMFNIRKELFHSLKNSTGEEFIKRLNFDEYMRK